MSLKIKKFIYILKWSFVYKEIWQNIPTKTLKKNLHLLNLH